MKYQVLDNDKPADCFNHKVDKSWNTNVFDTFDEALEYARAWLAPYGGSYDGKSGIVLKVNEPYDYSGYGDMIEIRGLPTSSSEASEAV